MGLTPYDLWSVGHFSMGIVSYYLLKKMNIETVENFVMSNGIHLMIEIIERSYMNGKVLETFENHVADVVLFLIGWLISMNIKSENLIPNVFVPFLWSVLIFTTLKEILQELYPTYKNPINHVWILLLVLTPIVLQKF
jgi:hypothetical protein